jgi:ubiquinone/menaquinone biosynthesis C-methylase UbiE
MDKTLNRKPFQGVFNIVRFNWHFYLLALFFFILFFFLASFGEKNIRLFFKITSILIFHSVFISLIVSYYIYDFKDFYSLNWLEFIELEKQKNIININAGFDETSAIIENKFPNGNLKVLDFYDRNFNTEISIERARQAYPAYKNTKNVSFYNLPIKDDFSELIFLIFAAHEIRKSKDRIIFFKELNRILEKKGKIILVEHLRDLPNFLAFNIGFLHFYSKKTWQNDIEKANLKITTEHKLTLFTSLFIIEKNGNPS